MANARQAPPHGVHELEVAIDLDGAQSSGDLAVPARALGLVLFADGSGTSRVTHGTAKRAFR